MISNFLVLAYSLFFACVVSYVNQINGNPHHLTLRGKRVLFVVSVVLGILIAQFILNIYVDCDLRTNATDKTCQIMWR
jgi:hypothetical protein